MPPFAPILLYVQGCEVFRFTADTRLPPSANAVQKHFDAHFRSRLGEGVVEDLHYVWNNDCLFVVRQPSYPAALWIHLDGDRIDFLVLDSTQDLSQIPVPEGRVLYPAEVNGDFGYVVSQDISATVTHDGPSRLRGVSRLPPPPRPCSRTSSADSSDDSRPPSMHSVFGSSVSWTVDSGDEVRLMLAEGRSSSPGDSASQSSASSDSSSSSIPAATSAQAAGTSLLQHGARLTRPTSRPPSSAVDPGQPATHYAARH